jgi:hypothetical protein
MAAVLLLGTTAAFAAGAFESDDSGLDTAHDRAERGLVTDDPSTTSTTLAEAPDDSLPPPTSPIGGNVADNDARSEDESFTAFPAGTTQSFAAGDAGVVTIRRDSGSLAVVDVRANAGWRVEVEQGAGLDVEVNFENDATRVDFNAELEDGAVRVRVRVRADADDEVVSAPTVPVTPAPSVGDPPRVDNSGPGSLSSGPGNGDDQASDDHSGSGRRSDDHPAGDDHSGSGHGGDDAGGDD